MMSMPDKGAVGGAARRRKGRGFLVVDDHPLFCEALTLALQSNFGADNVVCVSTLAAGLAALETGEEFAAVLLDLNLPDVTGFDGLIRLKSARPAAPVVVVSGIVDDRAVSSALKAGASGFVPKATAKSELIDALRQVMEGGIYTPPEYAPGEEDEEGGSAAVIGAIAELTPQQLRILSLMCEGKLNKQIAFDLSIAETTVKAHVTAILRKLKVRSRTQAVLLANDARFNEILKVS